MNEQKEKESQMEDNGKIREILRKMENDYKVNIFKTAELEGEIDYIKNKDM